MSKITFSQPTVSLLITLAISSLLFSCASNKTVVKKVDKHPDTEDISAIESLSAQTYLEKANSTSPEQAVSLFISASKQFIIEQQLAKALWLAEQTLPLINNNHQKNQLQLIKAESLTLTSKFDLALTAINAIENLDSLNPSQQHKYYQLLALTQENRGLPLAAINSKLHAYALQPQQSYDEVDNLWLELNTLSHWQIEELVLENPPHIRGWQQLLNFAQRFGYDPLIFNRYLIQWQRQFDSHPASILIPQLVNNRPVITGTQHKIAVILPLSGTQQSAGESAQQGILAAYNNNDAITLHFIDSNNLDMSSLNLKLSELQISHVIGPLLKENVNNYIAQTDLVLPTLLFNTPNTGQLKEHHMVLSMNPADEAIQAATTLSRRNYQHPIVFSQQDNVSKRIAQTFIQQWDKITGVTPEIVYVTNGANLQDELKVSLDVSSSQDRINNIDKRIRQKIKTQARNRRDLDMIYIVGSPNETRLLKPYIDVNISPFAETIPIFASSRSHSDNADSSDSRDLTGLQFTEMPWLLKSKQQNQSLKQLNEAIWPNRSDSLQRIFAMGYDSLSLIDKFQSFKQFPYIRHFGQTGIIKLNGDNILTRSLLWGRYQKDEVQEVALE
ncbi:penicillin-binding protein activator [Colwelliaceae bacterium 6441]